jgi:mannose-6-phosphate isomerase-like protein (cupin superfamily)
VDHSVLLNAVSRTNAEHYLWGERCHGWRLVGEADLSVIEEEMPAGRTEVLHAHRKAQQFFYMLDGNALMEMEGRVVPLSTGEGLRIPPGVRHRICNHSAAAIRFLVISQPTSAGDRIEDHPAGSQDDL